LWEVFLVEKLGFSFKEAHNAACELEHSTPNLVADRLEAFLEYPSVNPEGEPIPKSNGVLPTNSWILLTELPVGRSSHVIRCQTSQGERAFLHEQGIRPGAALKVLAMADDSLLVGVGDAQLSMARELAETVTVEMRDPE